MISALLASLMSILTLYMDNPEQSGSSAGRLNTSQPTASTSTTGWTVSFNGTTLYSRQSFRQERPSAEFASTAQPSGAPITKAEDTWRISDATTGTFSAGTWYSSISAIAVSSGGTVPTANVLHSGVSLVNASTYTTPSTIQCRANSLVLAIATQNNSIGPRTVSSVAGGGISTWVSVASQTYNTNAAISVWRGMTASPAAASRVTVIWSGTCANCCLSIVEFSGLDATGSNGANAVVQSATTTGTTSRATNILAAVSSESNIIVGAFSFATRNPGYTPGASTTELVDIAANETASNSNYVMWSTSSHTRPSAGATQSLAMAGIALELKTVFPSGRARFRIWRSANADGTSATEITQSTMVGSQVTGLSTTVAQSSSASTQVAGFSLTNEYLFLQAAWETITGGLSNSDDRLVRLGSMETVSGSGLVTADFTATGGGAAAVFGGMLMKYWADQVQEL